MLTFFRTEEESLQNEVLSKVQNSPSHILCFLEGLRGGRVGGGGRMRAGGRGQGADGVTVERLP